MGPSTVTSVPSGEGVGSGGGCACVRSGDTLEVSLPPSPFCYETKTALEQIAFFFKGSSGLFWLLLFSFKAQLQSSFSLSDYPMIDHPVCKLVEGCNFSIFLLIPYSVGSPIEERKQKPRITTNEGYNELKVTHQLDFLFSVSSTEIDNPNSLYRVTIYG